MKRFKGMLAIAAVSVGLSGAMFAQDQGRYGVRDDNNRAVYSPRQAGEREGAWNNGYRNGDNYRMDRDRDDRGRDRDWDRDAYRTRNREHRDRDHQRRDRDDRGRDDR